jgi:hypothetical protein
MTPEQWKEMDDFVRLTLDANRNLNQQTCRHERLNEDGYCRSCGADCRGIGSC